MKGRSCPHPPPRCSNDAAIDERGAQDRELAHVAEPAFRSPRRLGDASSCMVGPCFAETPYSHKHAESARMHATSRVRHVLHMLTGHQLGICAPQRTWANTVGNALVLAVWARCTQREGPSRGAVSWPRALLDTWPRVARSEPLARWAGRRQGTGPLGGPPLLRIAPWRPLASALSRRSPRACASLLDRFGESRTGDCNVCALARGGRI